MNDSIFENLFQKDFSNLLCKLESSLLEKKKEFIITANTEIVVNDNESVKNILLDENNIVVCDGIGLTKLASKVNKRKYTRIPGVELTYDLLDMAYVHQSKVYIYGSSLANIIELDRVIKDKFPGIKLVGMKDGYSNTKEDVKEDIIEKKPDIIIVALGVPAQELFIDSIISDVNKGIFIGVGGSLDVISGMKKRAPKIMIELHLEWLYRIIKEPKRAPRFIKNNIKLLFIKNKI